MGRSLVLVLGLLVAAASCSGCVGAPTVRNDIATEVRNRTMEAASGNVTLERLGPDGDGERSTWSFHLPPGAAVELGRMPLPQEMQEVFLHLTLSNGTSLGRYFPAWHAEKISVTLEPDQVWVGLSST